MVDFNLSDEQVALAEAASQLFAKNSGVEYARVALDDVAPLPQVDDLSSLGVVELLADETRGGGGTVLDLALVVEQAGRHLTPTRLISFAGRVVTLLESLASAAAHAVLERGLRGGRAVTVGDAASDTRDALRLDDAGLLSGRTGAVLDAAGATDVLLLVGSGSGSVVVAVDLVAAGDTVRRVRPKPLDATRGLEVLELEKTPVVAVAAGEAAVTAWARARDVAVVLLAAEDLGTATEANVMARGYAVQRHAFGRPVGSFQAVKHALVDSYVGEEQLRSLVWVAAWAADAAVEQLPLYAAAAAAYAAEVLDRATQTLIHVHGGIGFTWEHDAHLYWRRAQVDRSLLGDVYSHRRALAALNLGEDLLG